MNHKKMAGTSVLIIGLLVAGCGGTEADMTQAEAEGAVQSMPEAQPEAATHNEAAVVWCTDQSWKVAFYSDASMTTQVGYIQCRCYQQQIQSGITTNYQKLIYNYYCSLD